MCPEPATTIRTKVQRLSAEHDTLFFRPLERLRVRGITTREYQRQLLETLRGIDLAETFADTIAALNPDNPAEWLVRRHVDDCRYTIQLYYVRDGEVHAPHQHHNLISTQVVIAGSIHLREYQRLYRDDAGHLVLQPLRDEILGPGEAFQASEWHSNVHWFAAVDGPAILFNINARGYEQETFDTSEGQPFGRRYVDPTVFDLHGRAVCTEFDETEANRRFQDRPLSDFPMPASMNPARKAS